MLLDVLVCVYVCAILTVGGAVNLRCLFFLLGLSCGWWDGFGACSSHVGRFRENKFFFFSFVWNVAIVLLALFFSVSYGRVKMEILVFGRINLCEKSHDFQENLTRCFENKPDFFFERKTKQFLYTSNTECSLRKVLFYRIILRVTWFHIPGLNKLDLATTVNSESLRLSFSLDQGSHSVTPKKIKCLLRTFQGVLKKISRFKRHAILVLFLFSQANRN